MSSSSPTSVSALSRTDQPRVRAKYDFETLSKHFKAVRTCRGRSSLTTQGRMDIIHVFFTLHSEGLQNNKRPNSFRRTASLLGICIDTVRLVIKEWREYHEAGGDSTMIQNVVSGKGRDRNTTQRQVRIPNSMEGHVLVREFMRSQRMMRQRVTSRQVLDFLVEEKIISVIEDETGKMNSTALSSSLRCVQRYVHRRGFARGRKKGAVSIRPSHIAWRNRHIRLMEKYRSLPHSERYQEVYLDESYIHEHYAEVEDSLYDPNDDEYSEPKAKHKGKRYCFLAAIRGPGSSSPPGIVPGSVWSFCPQKKGHDKGDYHKVFNTTNFVAWFKTQLISNLTQRSLIIMDNASYHKSRVGYEPDGKMRKQDALNKLNQLGIPYDVGITAVEAKESLRKWFEWNAELEVVNEAEQAGHKVIFTPPCYSDLQPIELLWAYVKGRIGRQYSTTTTLSDVKRMVDEEFQNLLCSDKNQLVKRIIRLVDRKIQYFKEQIEEEESQADEEIFAENDTCSESSDKSDSEIESN